ncbi:RDD family protein [Flavobacterium foetidum]|uniref:RDD family protein n=1 Tax=Flavobacterium foetidum TaxID=2026681 RepID=UPI001074A82F|nr:RDD family protein [Flavobacterium foetidum]KAF2512630.1 RDD family protein [Flavobacterium foetidum]
MNKSTYVLDEKLLVSGAVRFVNYLLDNIFILILVFIFGFVMAIIASLFGLNGLLIWLDNIGDLEGRLLFILIAVTYYTITEGLLGRSFGKLITGTVVVDENGVKPSFGTIFKRSLCRIIPFDALTFLSSSSRGWHDSIPGTYVVNKKALDEEVKNFYEFNLIGETEVI